MRSRLGLLNMLLNENFLSLGGMVIDFLVAKDFSPIKQLPSIQLLEKYSSYRYQILPQISVNQPYSLFTSSRSLWISIFLQIFPRFILIIVHISLQYLQQICLDLQRLTKIDRMKLTKYQKRSLGIDKQQIPKQIWNQNMHKIYLKLDKKNKGLDEQGQTFDQFLQMQKQQPNQEGTGRYKFQGIQGIQLIFIPSHNNRFKTISIQVKNKISKFIQTFLRIPTKIKNQIKLTIKENNLIDKKRKLQYLINQQDQRLDVYNLLDVLMQYRQQKTILFGLIQTGLQQNGDILDGRACGDGVAIVSYQRRDLQGDIESLLQTVIHETCHTLGFDHCIAWQCLMNGWTNFQSWLCPACSRKLYHQLKLKTHKQIRQWVQQVVFLQQQLKFAKNARKGRMILQAIGQGKQRFYL